MANPERRHAGLRVALVTALGFSGATGAVLAGKAFLEGVSRQPVVASENQEGGIMPSLKTFNELVAQTPFPAIPTITETPTATSTSTATSTTEPTASNTPTGTATKPASTATGTATATEVPTQEPTKIPATAIIKPTEVPTAETAPTPDTTPAPTALAPKIEPPAPPTQPPPPPENVDPKKRLLDATKADLVGRLGVSPNNIAPILYDNALIWQKDGTILCPYPIGPKDGTGSTRSDGKMIAFYLKDSPKIIHIYFSDPNTGNFSYCGTGTRS
ncbi:hypothetical protein HY383_03380 [Candidatus Daviesbacteria bacterium]|nr:hypothetical protein [Candidatus Daviesbacteria bacterium]